MESTTMIHLYTMKVATDLSRPDGTVDLAVPEGEPGGSGGGSGLPTTGSLPTGGGDPFAAATHDINNNNSGGSGGGSAPRNPGVGLALGLLASPPAGLTAPNPFTLNDLEQVPFLGPIVTGLAREDLPAAVALGLIWVESKVTGVSPAMDVCGGQAECAGFMTLAELQSDAREAEYEKTRAEALAEWRARDRDGNNEFAVGYKEYVVSFARDHGARHFMYDSPNSWAINFEQRLLDSRTPLERKFRKYWLNHSMPAGSRGPTYAMLGSIDVR